MKKFRQIAAVLAVTALVLTGCGSKSKETEAPKETQATVAETQAPAAETEAAVVETEVEVAGTEAEAVVETEVAVVETEAEVVETEAEVVETEAEIVETEAEVAETEAEIVETEAEVVETEAEVAETEAEVVETEAEVVETEAEVVETEAVETEEETEADDEFDYSAVKTVSPGKLIVATEAGFAPYEYMVGDEVEGIDMDIVDEIADALEVELEIQNMDFDGALLAVQQGKVDLVAAGVSVSEEREKVMDFSEKYVDSRDVVVVNAEDPQVEESTAEALDGKVVGVQQGNIADLWVTENTSAKSVQRYTKFAQAAQDLANGKIDAIVMDEAPALELVAANDGLVILEGDPLFEDSYAIAIKKGNDDMTAAVNDVIASLKETGELDDIIADHSAGAEQETEAEADVETEAETEAE